MLFPPSASQVPPLLGGVSHMNDAGCHSWGPGSLWASFPCLRPSVEGPVFSTVAGGLLVCCAWQAPLLSCFSVGETPSTTGSARGSVSVLCGAGLLEGCGSAPQTQDRSDWRKQEPSVSLSNWGLYPVYQRSSGFGSGPENLSTCL